MSYQIGIDPGLNGAIAFIGPNGQFKDVMDLPTMAKHKATGHVKNCINAKALYDIIMKWHHFAPEIWLEQVSSMPTDGASSAFSFGDTFGSIRATCACTGLPVMLVAPSVWKKYFNIGKDKEVARALAINLFPTASSHLARKKDHDRAEALLVAKFGLLWGNQ